jgi:dienelactone hydrolase
VDGKRVGICGYSFGAIVAFSAALPDGVQAVVAISPPLTMASLDGLEGFARPKLLVSGGRDSFISEEAFHGFCQSLPAPKECEVVPEADHFWWGSEEQLAQRVASFFAGVFAV